ncbi:hypothetical protein ANN_18128 [Periplaneta americana]|uniref:Uncharacterized protein n=1 Tax=Periplaneta americana TaxID=6978 RepID=A0ABQ8SP94_PERAM|nr:hypothetical protein ANN_18128 [Periplaneta americana]
MYVVTIFFAFGSHCMYIERRVSELRASINFNYKYYVRNSCLTLTGFSERVRNTYVIVSSSLYYERNTKADVVYDRLTINITIDNFAKKLIIEILTSRIKATTVKIFTVLTEVHMSITILKIILTCKIYIRLALIENIEGFSGTEIEELPAKNETHNLLIFTQDTIQQKMTSVLPSAVFSVGPHLVCH